MQAARVHRHINKDCLRMLILFSPINAANSITRHVACWLVCGWGFCDLWLLIRSPIIGIHEFQLDAVAWSKDHNFGAERTRACGARAAAEAWQGCNQTGATDGRTNPDHRT